MAETPDPFFTANNYVKAMLRTGALKPASPHQTAVEVEKAFENVGKALSATASTVQNFTQSAQRVNNSLNNALPTVSQAVARGTSIHRNIERRQAVGSLAVEYGEPGLNYDNNVYTTGGSEERLKQSLQRFVKPAAEIKKPVVEPPKPGPSRIKRTIST
jgi:Tat protein secretion system quality control protein TatD with DNase activity